MESRSCLLAPRRLCQGWEYYEVRFENEDFAHVKIPTSGRRIRCLDDMPSSGQAPVVVWSEQGLGDAIQFSRYLHLLDAAEFLSSFNSPIIAFIISRLLWSW